MRPKFRRLSITVAATLLLLPMSAVQAQVTTFFAFLNGLSESPSNASPATGQTTVTLNQTLNTLRVQVVFFGLVAPNTAAHIHCCLTVPFTGTAGVATVTPTFTNFPTGTTSGTYDFTYDLLSASTYNPAFVTLQGGVAQAYAALANGLLTPGQTYLNVHSQTFGGGEIRGFLVVTPEPSTYALMASGLVALGIVARKRRKA